MFTLYVTAGDICEVNDVPVPTEPCASVLRKTFLRTKPFLKGQSGLFDLVNRISDTNEWRRLMLLGDPKAPEGHEIIQHLTFFHFALLFFFLHQF